MRLVCFTIGFLMLVPQLVFAEKQYVARVVVTAVGGGGVGNWEDEQKEGFRSRLVQAILAQGLFDVDTRSAREAEILLSDPGSRIAASNAARPIDFFIVPVVDVFDLVQEARPFCRAAGKFTVSIVGPLSVRIRIISARTGQVRSSYQFDERINIAVGRVDSGMPFGKKTIPNFDGNCAAGKAPIPLTTPVEKGQGFFAAADKVSRALAARLEDVLAPAEVIKVSGQTVWISRGSDGGWSVGDRFAVFSGDGEALKHPVTGEVLGTAEMKVAIVTLTTVENKYSIGTLSEISGLVATGSTVR